MYLLYIQIQYRDTKTWTEVKVKGPTVPLPRSRHTAVLYNHYMIVFGGGDRSNYYNDLAIFDLRILYLNPLLHVVIVVIIIHLCGILFAVGWLLDSLISIHLDSKTWRIIESILIFHPKEGTIAQFLSTTQRRTTIIITTTTTSHQP